MKRDLLILFALLCCALITTYILAKGADPDRIFTSHKRNYDRFTLQSVDTVLFPGRVSIMKAAQGNIYGYVYSKKTIFRYNTNLHQIDSFFTNRILPMEIVTRLEVDTGTHTFYIFGDTGKKIVTYQAGSGKPDSIMYADTAHTYKDISRTTYMITNFDTSKKVAQLKLRNFNAPAQDTTLFEFPRFEDGGLSADGFYTKNTGNQFYIPFYNGGIIRYDKIHNDIRLMHTIDNTPPSNIAVPSGNIYTRSSKSIIVNSTATADDQYLYILSYVLSEDAVASNYRGPAVDVYNIQDGQYEGSFRFPGYQNKPVLQLAKCADTLIAAYENNILLFKLTGK
ncbi:hypothetical protein GO495_17315 [Chitinophaga oryziterrae]|uniref:6-bladed beta-propeller n=1 Tax=Chitinophaga oryziterrae TaxID=1031224 RepID=A0A6N8JAP0_9BACT|nr:hypothetical protein [Chitinophaga oryziterrae]MVT42355.1 hypothetical protein [Chitinophaga oryziterrae]